VQSVSDQRPPFGSIVAHEFDTGAPIAQSEKRELSGDPSAAPDQKSASLLDVADDQYHSPGV
jgi:hypothetical protein